jgi:polyphenol oxidase
MVHGDGLADADELLENRVQIPDSNLDVHQNHALLEPEGADAIYSRRSECLLAVTMADCLTALIFDPLQKTIAAVHAGWRGTHLEILGKTLMTLTSKGLINPKDTWVAFGPCLRAESLEVGESIAGQLDTAFVIRKSGKFFFDMPASNKEQAMRAGIPIQQIRDMGGNTMNEPDQYFSYRRDGQASGRLAAFISLV